MHVVASKKKAELVATVTDAAKAVGVTLQTHVREKDGDGSTQMTAALTALGGDSPTLATLLKEKLEGTFIKVRVNGRTMPAGGGIMARDVATEVRVQSHSRMTVPKCKHASMWSLVDGAEDNSGRGGRERQGRGTWATPDDLPQRARV
jgi:hypothetical protein